MVSLDQPLSWGGGGGGGGGGLYTASPATLLSGSSANLMLLSVHRQATTWPGQLSVIYVTGKALWCK